MTRRFFLKLAVAIGLVINLFPWFQKRAFTQGKITRKKDVGLPLGVDDDGFSYVYLVKNGSPEDNIQKAIDLMGGIEHFISKQDIVVLKPNAQRYNQGMTNTDAMKGFIDLVLSIEGFSGEVIIAENHQYQDDNSCGWTTDERNGKFNLNELVEYYQKKGYPNVTKYHWHVAGPCKYPLEGNGQGESRVNGPEEGDGYVWMEDDYYLSPSGHICLMTYPIFTSSYSGITIDLKKGAWKNGEYLAEKRLRFVNFAGLNHHGRYAGATASVKNLMGVVDMTCGFPGDLCANTYNTHHIGVSRMKHWLHHGHWRIRSYKGWLRYKFEDYCYRNFHYTGGALGNFMAKVRMPDLNIIAADLVGWGTVSGLTWLLGQKHFLLALTLWL